MFLTIITSLGECLVHYYCYSKLLGIIVLAQVLTTKIKDENKGTKIDNRQ